MGVAKYRSVKAFSMGQAVASMILNLTGEKSEEEVMQVLCSPATPPLPPLLPLPLPPPLPLPLFMQDGTFIRAERFDFGSEARPFFGPHP